MKKWSYGLLIAISSVAVTWFFIRATGNDRENRKAEFNARYGIYALDLPAKVTFASEEVPLNVTDVRERFDRELLVNTYWQSQTLLMLKRKERWFPVIEPILKANHIPDDFKYRNGRKRFHQYGEPIRCQRFLAVSGRHRKTIRP